MNRNGPGLLETMEEQVGYMNKIVCDLQDYAKPLKAELAETDLRGLIDDTLSITNVPETIDVHIEIETSAHNLIMDKALMKRAFANLITNAVQAMPDGGRLTIRASKTGGIALVSIHDTGVGIPKENLDKLFTVMFTTKARGQGFGLAVCKRIAEAHGGEISVESTVGKGTTILIRLPNREETN